MNRKFFIGAIIAFFFGTLLWLWIVFAPQIAKWVRSLTQ